jgi:hypothetical protein
MSPGSRSLRLEQEPRSDAADASRLSLLPVNQAATLKLRGLGMPAESRVQPVFRLMAWGIGVISRNRYRDLASELEQLQSAPDQKAAFDYLFTRVPGGLREFTRRMLRLDARSAAWALLDQLDMRLKAEPEK